MLKTAPPRPKSTVRWVHALLCDMKVLLEKSITTGPHRILVLPVLLCVRFPVASGTGDTVTAHSASSLAGATKTSGAA